jgi:epoxyqueuosine reductase
LRDPACTLEREPTTMADEKQSVPPEGNPPEADEGGSVADPDRRNFIKIVAAAAAGLGASGVGTYAGVKMQGTPHDEVPVPVKDDLEPFDQRDMLWTFVASKKLNEEHPERTAKFGGFSFHEKLTTTYLKGPVKDVAGYTQLDRALGLAGWEPNQHLAPGQQYGQPGSGILSWDQSDVAETRYEFPTERDAALAIKSAARLFGATRCGITRRDQRWDYDPLYDIENERVLTWEEDFPFEPRTVIVMATEMDYEAMRTSPAWTSMAPAGDGYGMGDKAAGQIAKFLRGLGYHAVGSNNDLGMNVPYAVAAGLGEGARNGSLIAPTIGPRHRLCKVYTDFDFVEYDRPRDFGVASFCANCKRCADSCPSEAITQAGDPSWGPEYEGGGDPDYAYHARSGVLKYHNDAKKCLKFWIENDGGCSNCITSCPYNKPDFWHHRFIDAQNVISPGPMHALMREMDILFGYGTVSDPTDVTAFWKSGKNMRGG